MAQSAKGGVGEKSRTGDKIMASKLSSEQLLQSAPTGSPQTTNPSPQKHQFVSNIMELDNSRGSPNYPSSNLAAAKHFSSFSYGDGGRPASTTTRHELLGMKVTKSQSSLSTPKSNVRADSKELQHFSTHLKLDQPERPARDNGVGESVIASESRKTPDIARRDHRTKGPSSPSRSRSPAIPSGYVEQRQLELLQGLLQCSGVEKAWTARRVQRAYDQWVMFTNGRIAREVADRISSSRKHEEELHGASLRKITQEFILVSEKMSGFDRTEKMLKAKNKSLETQVSSLQEEMDRLKSENTSLQKTVETSLSDTASRNARGIGLKDYTGAENGSNVLLDSCMDAMEDSLLALASPGIIGSKKEKLVSPGRNGAANEARTMDTTLPKRRQSTAESSFRKYTGKAYITNGPKQDKKTAPRTASTGRSKAILTMNELMSIQNRLSSAITQRRIQIEQCFTHESITQGQPLADFVQILLNLGLGLDILDGRELAGLLNMLDTNNTDMINVEQFLQFLDLEPSVSKETNFSVVDQPQGFANLANPAHVKPIGSSHQRSGSLLFSMNSKKSQLINDFFQSRRHAFVSIFKNFANTNSHSPWMDFARWVDFCRHAGVITGFLSRRQVENVFRQISQPLPKSRISFKLFMKAIVDCAESMSGPYSRIEDRIAWLFKRFSENGQRIPGASMFLDRVLESKETSSPWAKPGVASKWQDKESTFEGLGAPADISMAPPNTSVDRPGGIEAPSRSTITGPTNTPKLSRGAYVTASSDDLSFRDVASLRSALTVVVKDTSAKLLRHFLTMSPSQALSYTRFTRLIRESLRQCGHALSGGEAAYLLRTVDPHGDGIIYGDDLKKFLGLNIVGGHAWGSPQRIVE